MASKAVRVLTRTIRAAEHAPGMWPHPNHGSIEGTLACAICGRTFAEQRSQLDWFRDHPEQWERRIREIVARDERRSLTDG